MSKCEEIHQWKWKIAHEHTHTKRTSAMFHNSTVNECSDSIIVILTPNYVLI
jgi:hypothetical protein